jgi:hypothetical protein
LKKYLFSVTAAILNGWRRRLDIILKGTHPRSIPAWFDLIWFCDFREDINVKVYDVRRTPNPIK